MPKVTEKDVWNVYWLTARQKKMMFITTFKHSPKSDPRISHGSDSHVLLVVSGMHVTCCIQQDGIHVTCCTE